MRSLYDNYSYFPSLVLIILCILMTSTTTKGYQRTVVFRWGSTRCGTNSCRSSSSSSSAVASSKGEVDSNNVEWGKSYIGQDVCGSKYNDDPFDEQGDKPDAWSQMKARIADIEKAAQEAANVNKNSTLVKNASEPTVLPRRA